MSAADVRRAFLSYFAERGHTIVPSASLVPGNDPTLLFTNAGMVQFKDVFLGKDQRDYVRATSSQRCVRAGGKHNDLENVGYTARHHTFFEMLGNFSFGDYFKRDAIHFAWEFVTKRLGLDPKRLWVTVFREDDEAADIWIKETGIDPARLTRLGEASNFWSMGDTGPCGPCTEIFWDHGPSIKGGPPGSPDEDGDRYVEIWNLVFMQFERDADGTMKPLPKPSVDTGAGLERVAAVMQGVHSNYDIDLFQGLIKAAASLLNTKDMASPSLRVIADHIRSAAFLIGDGVLPSNEGRGYVLRRIVRRAMRHGHQYGASPVFFHKMVAPLVAAMGEAYPELVSAQSRIENALRAEGERFAETLENGMALLDEAIRHLNADKVIDGATVFKLYDTYGFPVDLTADVARERGLAIDMVGFEAAMEAQRDRARAASRFGVDQRAGTQIAERTEFCGYDGIEGDSKVVALLREGQSVAALKAGETGEVVLERTPFYAESGGQVGDAGVLSTPVAAAVGAAAAAAGAAETGTPALFIVTDTQKRGAAFSHIGKLEQGALKIGDTLHAAVDGARRDATRRNHTATHLLHAALRQVLGTHVVQKGSLVAPDRLRFDFAHIQPITPDELKHIERLVNEQIRANAPADTGLMSYDDAVASGAMALFGEKYESQVRVLKLGDFSTELCGGTHVARTGDIGLFRIISESGVAAGVRRIEAVSGEGALDQVDRTDAVMRAVAALVRGNRDDAVDKVRDLLEKQKQLEKELRSLREKLASGQGTDLASTAIDVNGIKVVAARVDGADANSLRSAVDQLKTKLGAAIIVLASVESASKVVLVAGVTARETSQVKAGELVASIASQIGGKGGGRADFAQAGGTRPESLDAALAGVIEWVKSRLAA